MHTFDSQQLRSILELRWRSSKNRQGVVEVSGDHPRVLAEARDNSLWRLTGELIKHSKRGVHGKQPIQGGYHSKGEFPRKSFCEAFGLCSICHGE